MYSAYGVQTVLTGAWTVSSASNSVYGFQGGRFDVATGLNHFGARDYDAVAGTWVEADPQNYIDGMDDYEFVLDGPTENRDSTGHNSEPASQPAPQLPSTQPSGPGVSLLNQGASAAMPGAQGGFRNETAWSAAHFTGELIQHVTAVSDVKTCDGSPNQDATSQLSYDYYESWTVKDGVFSIRTKGGLVSEQDAGSKLNVDEWFVQAGVGDTLRHTYGWLRVTAVAKLIPAPNGPTITAHDAPNHIASHLRERRLPRGTPLTAAQLDPFYGGGAIVVTARSMR